MAKPSATPVKKVPAKKAGVPAKKNAGSSALSKYDNKFDKLTMRQKQAGKILFDVKILAKSAVIGLPGYILSIDEKTLVLNHTKPRSSKETVSHIPMRDVVMFMGNVGERCFVYVRQNEVIREIKRATITSKNGAHTIVSSDSHDSFTFFDRDDSVVMIAEPC